MDSGLLSLKWNNHSSTFFDALESARKKGLYSDVTIACEGKYFEVHKLVLSTCSDYFQEMFERTQCKHPIVVLKDISQKDLEFLLNYMYVGEVNVLQNELSSLIKAAECLRVKGLAVPDEPPSSNKSHKRRSSGDKDENSIKRSKRSQANSSVPRPESSSPDPANSVDDASHNAVSDIPPIETLGPISVKEETVERDPFVEGDLEPNVKFEHFEEELTDKDVDRDGDAGRSMKGGANNSNFTSQCSQESQDNALNQMPSTSGFVDSSHWPDDIETLDDDDDYGVAANFDPTAFADPSLAKSQMELAHKWRRLRAPPGENVAYRLDETTSALMAKQGTTWKCLQPNCSYQSYSKSNVIMHIRSHTGARPFECNVCQFSTKTSSNLYRHMRNRHFETNA